MGSPDQGHRTERVCTEQQAESTVCVFSYGDKDVKRCLDRQPGWTRGDHSEFDSLVCRRWDEASRGGMFRYTLDDVTTRLLSGSYGLVLQRNPKRFSHRRKPADMQFIVQPFDHDQFNFNKISKSEILMEIRRESGCHGDVDKLHWLTVNVSPIEYGHVLLVPDPPSCLPQVFTEDSIHLCLDIVAMSGHNGFCMVGNSLLAYASVNHLHYHFMYIAQPLLAARVIGRPITSHCYELINHISPGFGFEIKSSTAECAKDVYKLVSLLLDSNIPHNLVMLRGNPFNQDSSELNCGTVVKILLIPRKPTYGLKSVYESDSAPPFFAAACELGLGFIPVIDQSKYNTLTEGDALKLLYESILSPVEFSDLRTEAMQRLA